VDKVVKVDFYIHGCPSNNAELARALKGILLGKGYQPPKYAVCVECKLRENVCMYEKDQVCLGPVTRAGCDAWCTSNGNVCYGCRGLLDNPNLEGSMEVLKSHGYKLEQLKQKYTLYNSCKLSGDKAWKTLK
jgi:sulfhydrogenase subunit delta